MSQQNYRESTVVLLKRYLWLVDLIRRSGGVSLSEIQDQWLHSRLNEERTSLPRRTFHAHKAAIEQLFDIEIECTIPGYKYRILESDDSGYRGAAQWLLDAFSVHQSLMDGAHIRDSIMLESNPAGTTWLSEILESLESRTAIRITYRNFFRSDSSTFIVEPYGLRCFQRRWYLVANNPNMDDQVRIYGLDRIETLERIGQHYQIPKDFSLRTYFEGQFGVVFSDTEPEVVRIKADKYHARYLQALPLHSSQLLVEDHEEYAVYSYYLKPTYDFYHAIMEMGTHVEVLSPKHVRETLVEELKAIAQVYLEERMT